MDPSTARAHLILTPNSHPNSHGDIREEVTCAAACLPLASAPSIEANRSYVHSDPAHVMGPAALSRECPYSDHSPGGKPVRTAEAHMRASVHGGTRAHTRTHRARSKSQVPHAWSNAARTQTTRPKQLQAQGRMYKGGSALLVARVLESKSLQSACCSILIHTTPLSLSPRCPLHHHRVRAGPTHSVRHRPYPATYVAAFAGTSASPPRRTSLCGSH